ncbi:hypothetical protein K503DRAFT_776317 [Rhizopogon vinicolor AM-OR11-026]|uniref:Uncharacterized protein n=1 Tax=Rhizopogon vinicolor AM-OR11-026 TaxID=1314800 RepID=A0A1B7MJI8_9AGAM|nr:hypothetical protein K503DRAFT_776317 [Rhizopogon vinicolor AM-OR11-026]
MRSVKKAAVWLFLAVERVLTAQIPLLPDYHEESLDFYSHFERSPRQWDLDEPHAVNATGNLVFETANSLLQHWANTRYRIGHTIIPGIVPVGTILYHGALSGPHIPTTPDWVAMEPEHSMVFCSGSVETGCWHVTFAVTRPMKVLYFDGSSAANIPEGTMDTQDLVAWSEMRPEWVDNEEQRIQDLCKWGLQNGINGLVRMEVNFEIMICNFTSHMEVISFSNLDSPRLKIGNVTDLPEDPNSVHHAFEIMHSTSWRENYPGETRIVLDYSALISFYDTDLVPSLMPRRVGLERWDHRVAGISPEDIERVEDRLAQVLERPPVTASGIDWKTVLRSVVDRYASRLDVMQYLTNITLDDTPVLLDRARKVQRQLRTMLAPYILLAALPPRDSVEVNATHSWAAPVFQGCATTHTSFIGTRGILTPSERLLLQAVQETSREICRVITRIWASGFIAGLDPLYPADQDIPADRIRTLMGEWKEDIARLMSWLDWSIWVKCRPACGVEEMCYLPTWPIGFFPPDHPFQAWNSASTPWPDPNEGEWKRPQPKCIRRLEPYGF